MEKFLDHPAISSYGPYYDNIEQSDRQFGFDAGHSTEESLSRGSASGSLIEQGIKSAQSTPYLCMVQGFIVLLLRILNSKRIFFLESATFQLNYFEISCALHTLCVPWISILNKVVKI